MQTIRKLIKSFQSRSIKLWLADGQLHYSAPNNLTDQDIEELKTNKSAIIAFLRQTSSFEYQETVQHASMPIDRFPITEQQKQLIYIDQADPNKTAYNIYFSFLLTGPVCQRTLEGAIKKTCERHNVLRTEFIEHDGNFYQSVSEHADVELIKIDYSHLTAEGFDRQIRNETKRLANMRMDVLSAPLCRYLLLVHSKRRAALIIVAHHIIADGTSLPIFQREIAEHYRALQSNSDPQLHPLPLQFTDFSENYSNFIESDEYSVQLKQRAEHFQEFDLSKPFIPDFHGREKPSRRPGFTAFALNQETRELIANVAKRTNTSVFAVLLASTQIAISIWINRDKIIVGSPIDLRDDISLEENIGMFVNLLALGLTTDRSQSFIGSLRETQNAVLDAIAAKRVALNHLQSELSKNRDGSNVPLINMDFSFMTVAPAPIKGGPVLFEPIDQTEHYSTKFDVSIFMMDQGNEIKTEIVYRSELFERDRMDLFAAHLNRVVNRLAYSPEKPISALSFQLTQESAILVEDTQNTDRTVPQALTIDARFAQTVAQSPKATAIICGNTEYSYEELDHLSNEFAAFLISKELPRTSVVAVSMNRSLALIVTLLAVTKTGAAYLPIAENTPNDRLDLYIREASARLCITDDIIKADPISCETIKYENVPIDRYHGIQRNLEASHKGQDLAYVMFTSGSTGVPKGVMVSHENVVSLIDKPTYVSLDKNTRMLAASNIAFDAATFEIWGALLNGGSLVLVQDRATLSPSALKQFIQDYRVNGAFVTTSLFNSIISADVTTFNALETLIFGGESASVSAVSSYRAACPKTRLVNAYGPTEATTFASAYFIGEIDQEQKSIPIGKAINATRLYVLDENLNPLPIGAQGELCIAGEGIARGYLNEPAVTAEKFVADPFGAPGSRMYRTGDIVISNPDGTLTFLGRNDSQIKLRGYRIDLEEIRRCLEQLDEVQQSFVTTVENRQRRRIVAYVTMSQSLSEAEIKTHLSTELLPFMVPDHIIFLDVLPLTQNGKVDERSLPKPNFNTSQKHLSTLRKATPMELVIQDVWSQALNLEQVGLTDKFYDLGGDSITALIVKSLAKKHYLEIDLQRILENPTVEALARHTSKSTEVQVPVQRFALLGALDQQTAREKQFEDVYPATKLQLGMIFHADWQPQSSLFNVVISQRIECPLLLDRLENAVNNCVARHPALRTNFDLSDFSIPVQTVSKSRVIKIEVIDWSNLSEGEVETSRDAFIQSQMHKKFELSHEILIRLFAAKVNPDAFIFITNFHHAILDGWSDKMMMNAIFDEYFADLKGLKKPRIERPGFNPAELVKLEQRSLDSADDRHFWVNELETVPKSPLWKIRRKRASKKQSVRGGQSSIVKQSARTHSLKPHECETINDFLRQYNLPAKSFFLAAHIIALHRFFGDNAVATNLVYNTRPEVTDGDKILGLFLNALPIVHQTREYSDWPEFVRHVMEIENRLIPRRWFPLSVLKDVDETFNDVEIMFNFTNFASGNKGKKHTDLEQTHAASHTDMHWQIDVSYDGKNGMGQLSISWAEDHYPVHHAEAYLETLHTIINSIAHEDFAPSGLFRVEQDIDLQNECDIAGAAPFLEEFYQRVQSAPTSVAIIDDEYYFTYAELDEKSNQIGHFLSRQGDVKSAPFGVVLSPSRFLPVVLLALLKIGGQYVPIDTALPINRKKYILENSGASFVIANDDHELGASEEGLIIINQSKLVAASVTEAVSRPDSSVGSDFKAYTLYTSGSTGTPKGVIGSYKALAYRCALYGQLVTDAGLEQKVVSAHKAPISFIDSIFEMLGPLYCGHAVSIFKKEELKDFERFAGRVSTDGCNVLVTVPTLAKSLLQLDECHKKFEKLKLWILGGEVLDTETSSLLRIRFPACHFVNLYGSTEVTDAATTFKIPERELDVVSIGAAVPYSTTYILSDDLHPIPDNVTGRIFVGGKALPMGYHEEAGLTAEKYIADPFGENGARMYDTGDLGWRDSDGQVFFAGRSDNQVKIHGNRVDLSEIENLLLSQPKITQAVAVKAEVVDGTDDHILVFYVGEQDGADLKEILSETLPYYMVPRRIENMIKLPVSTNGKVDRLQLSWRKTHTLVKDPSTGRTVTEKLLTKVWIDALGHSDFSVNDSYFQIGGNSLKAVVIRKKIEEICNAKISISDIYQFNTIRSLALYIDTEFERPQSETELVYLRTCRAPTSRVAIIPTIFGTGIHFLELSSRLSDSTEFTTCTLPGLENDSHKIPTIEGIAQYCIEALVKVDTPPDVIVGWSFGGIVSFEIARQLKRKGEFIPKIISIDAFLPSNASDLLGRLNNNMEAEFDDVIKRSGLVSGKDTTAQNIANFTEHYFEMYANNAQAIASYNPPILRTEIKQVMTLPTLARLDHENATIRPLPVEHKSIHEVAGDHFSILSSDLDGLITSLRTLLFP